MKTSELVEALAEAVNWLPGALALPGNDAPPPSQLPDAYLQFLKRFGPGEGFVGYEYLRLFAERQVRWVNEAYRTDEFLPGYCLFGSNGGGEAYLFSPAEGGTGDSAVVKIPFVPLDLEYANSRWGSFSLFLQGLIEAPRRFAESTYPDTPNPAVVGKELHEIQPVALGGDPTDPKSKVLVPIEEHAELCSLLNRTFRVVRDQSRRG